MLLYSLLGVKITSNLLHYYITFVPVAPQSKTVNTVFAVICPDVGFGGNKVDLSECDLQIRFHHNRFPFEEPNKLKVMTTLPPVKSMPLSSSPLIIRLAFWLAADVTCVMHYCPTLTVKRTKNSVSTLLSCLHHCRLEPEPKNTHGHRRVI